MSARFECTATPLAGLCLVQRRPISDARGSFERIYCSEELEALTGGAQIRQINRTLTLQRGTVRGMHFQYPPHAEAKFISCLRGAVFDVAVDIRRGSPTFLRWHAERLSADNHRTLLLPPGFAHGFQTLEEECELLYLHTARYEPAAEGGLNALDPRLAIAWPETVRARSPRDVAQPNIDADFQGVNA